MAHTNPETRGELEMSVTLHEECYLSRGMSLEDAGFLLNFPENDKKRVLRKVMDLIDLKRCCAHVYM
jgi:hypothetical protein